MYNSEVLSRSPTSISSARNYNGYPRVLFQLLEYRAMSNKSYFIIIRIITHHYHAPSKIYKNDTARNVSDLSQCLFCSYLLCTWFCMSSDLCHRSIWHGCEGPLMVPGPEDRAMIQNTLVAHMTGRRFLRPVLTSLTITPDKPRDIYRLITMTDVCPPLQAT